MEEQKYHNVSKRWLTKHTVVCLGQPRLPFSYTPIVIKQVNYEEVDVLLVDGWREMTVDYRDIFPCPIENHILIKFGFRGYKINNVIHYWMDLSDFQLDITRNIDKSGEWILTINEQSTLYISHMHVLQHTVTLLTNHFKIISKYSCKIPSEEYDEALFEIIRR